MTPEDNVKIMYEQLDARLISAKATGLYHEDYFRAIEHVMRLMDDVFFPEILKQKAVEIPFHQNTMKS